jgi:hypothetical protein
VPLVSIGDGDRGNSSAFAPMGETDNYDYALGG